MCELAQAALMQLEQCTGQNEWLIFERGSHAVLLQTPSQRSLGIKLIAPKYEHNA